MCTKRPQALKTRVSFDEFWIKFEIKWQNINVGIPRRSFLPFSAFPAVRGNAEKVTSLIFLVCALNGMRIHQMRLVCLKGKRLASRMTPTRIAYVVYLACYGRQKKSLRRSPNFPYVCALESELWWCVLMSVWKCLLDGLRSVECNCPFSTIFVDFVEVLL